MSMLFESRLSLKELTTNVRVDTDGRIEVKQTSDGYEASNPYTTLIVGKGATPLDAVIDFLGQQLHTIKAFTFEKES